jgi:hypothetical protein
MSFLKGFRTYLSLVVVAVMGAAVAVQQSCVGGDPEAVNKVCEVVNQGWFGQAIVAGSAIAAWFRKKA